MIKISGKQRKRAMPFLYLLPALILLVVITVYPCVCAIVYAFTDYNLMFPTYSFIGFGNFQELFRDNLFRVALRNSFVWVLGIVAVEFILGLAIALILYQDFPGRGICRALVLFPWVIPWVVAGVLWKSIYNPMIGPLNYILKSMHIIDSNIAWLGSDYALFSLMVIMIWKMTPFMVITLLAGLEAIPIELYEAARVDGASAFQTLRKITLPLLKPIAGVGLALSFIWVFNNFDLVYSTTQGGPVDVTMLLSVLTYRNSFSYYRIGYGASIGLFMLLILTIPVYIYLRQVLGRENI